MKRIVLIGLMALAFSANAIAQSAGPDRAEARRVKEMQQFFRDQLSGEDARKIAAIEAGQQAVRRKLLDPGAAQFREVFLADRGGHVCGQVNAKNKFGGYVGFKRFVAGGDGVAFEDDAPAFFDLDWQSKCFQRPE